MPDTLRRHRGTTLLTIAALPVLFAAGLLVMEKPVDSPRPVPVRSERVAPVPDVPRPQPLLTTTFGEGSEAEPTMVW